MRITLTVPRYDVLAGASNVESDLNQPAAKLWVVSNPQVGCRTWAGVFLFQYSTL